MKNNVLIIDSDIENCKQIKYHLQDDTTDVYYTHSVKEALHAMHTKPCTLIIMDVFLSQEGGLGVLEEIRQMNDAPILVLSGQSSPAERVLAFKYGADDVLNKPYDLEECLARAQVLIKRYSESNCLTGRSYAVVGFEDLFLNTAKRKVSIAGKDVILTRKEYGILLYMLTHRKQVLTFEQIYTSVWKETFLGDNSTIFYHVAQLRKKLGEDWIENVYGVGYCMRDPKTS